MILSHDFSVSLKEYAERAKENDFPDIDRCPHCKAMVKLKRHGFFWRNAIEDETYYRIPVCRLKCSSCGKTASLLPDFLLPYFQHTLNTVLDRLKESLVNKVTDCYQLAQFYRKRFFRQLNQVEMFFRAEGFREVLPRDNIEKAIKLLQMISALGKASFVRRSRGHFTITFMAN